MTAAKKKMSTVGVIGLGIMGGAFAKNLAAAGLRVVGFDLSPKARSAAARAGVEIASSASDVASKAPIVLTSPPKPPQRRRPRRSQHQYRRRQWQQ